jgi:tetratricopeptide (TPR) repeat protein
MQAADHQPSWKQLLLVALLALVAHAASLGTGWIWDDDSYVTANRLMSSPSGFVDSFIPGTTPQYYPLVFAGLWVQHAVVGTEPFAYHLVNVLMHAANAVLLVVVLTRLGVRHALWIGALFAAHPMGVESVAWVTERKNVQSMLFALASVLIYLRFLDAPKGRVLGTWLAAFLLFVGALLSKTTAIFVPPCLVLAMLWMRRPINARFITSVVPFFVVGVAAGLFTAHVERTIVGAAGEEFSFSILERLQIAGHTAAFYPVRFMLPTEQVFIYPRFTPEVSNALAWTPFALGLIALTVCILRWSRARGPLLVLLWYGAALFPALGFFDVWPFRYSFVADHFAYAAMPVLALGSVVLVTTALARIPARTATIGASVAVVACIALAWRATAKYENEETLWLDTARRNPEAWIAHNNLASIELQRAGEALERRDPDAARVHAMQALERSTRAGELKPDEASNATNRSEAHRLLGDLDAALREIELAASLQPKYGDFQWSRAWILEMMGRTDDARAAFELCAELGAGTRDESAARRDLLRLAIARDDHAEAIRQCRALLALEPRNPDVIASLGSLLVKSGDTEQARREFRRALALRPLFASDRALVAASLGYLRLVIDTRPDTAELAEARAAVDTLKAFAPNDPGTRFLDLAVRLIGGDAAARAEIERMERDARAAGGPDAITFADQVAAFLARRPIDAR